MPSLSLRQPKALSYFPVAETLACPSEQPGVVLGRTTCPQLGLAQRGGPGFLPLTDETRRCHTSLGSHRAGADPCCLPSNFNAAADTFMECLTKCLQGDQTRFTSTVTTTVRRLCCALGTCSTGARSPGVPGGGPHSIPHTFPTSRAQDLGLERR